MCNQVQSGAISTPASSRANALWRRSRSHSYLHSHVIQTRADEDVIKSSSRRNPGAIQAQSRRNQDAIK